VVWNGNLGKTEDVRFEKTSREVAEFLGKSSAKTMILGGDTTGYVLNLAEQDKSLRFDFISTGGSASLRFLADGTLPGLETI
jgi:phosphoglycerate kinase